MLRSGETSPTKLFKSGVTNGCSALSSNRKGPCAQMDTLAPKYLDRDYFKFGPKVPR